jgi:EAL and modified HD-GYP domain-containing signal transduction protein
MGALDYLIGRQPIFDQQSNVLGYELTLRDMAGKWSKDYTAHPIIPIETFYSALPQELDNVVGNKKLFCPVTDGLLQAATPLSLPPARTVLEVSMDKILDDARLKSVRNLSVAGYSIALDGLLDADRLKETLSAISTIEFVKVDTSSVDPSTAASIVQHARIARIKTVAAGIDLAQQFRECVQMGFDYFQGYFLAIPQPVPNKTLAPTRIARLQLAVKLTNQEADVKELEKIVRMDPALATQLLELAGLGSAGGLRREIKSLHDAIVLLGWRRLQSWIALLIATHRDETSQEELANALIRSRMCEMIAERVNPGLKDEALTAGMLSTLDLLLKIPLHAIIESLPVHPELEAAVLLHEGIVGGIVADAIDVQLGKLEVAVRSGLPEDKMQSIYISALDWYNQAFASTNLPQNDRP